MGLADRFELCSNRTMLNRLTRWRHGKHVTQKEIASSDSVLSLGATAPGMNQPWSNFSITLRKELDETSEHYVLSFGADDAERIATQLRTWLDERKNSSALEAYKLANDY